MMATRDEKDRVMKRCIDEIPRQFRIADKWYERSLDALGRGSWAVAFSATRFEHATPGDKGTKKNHDYTLQEHKLAMPSSVEKVAFDDQAQVTLVNETFSIMSSLKSVAVKAIIKEMHSEQTISKYTQREIDIMRRLTAHENVVKLFAYWSDAKCFFLAMELCTNRSLSRIVKAKDVWLSSTQINRYLRQMLLGLHYIHQQMVVHRDLKPDNVLLNGDNQVKISDFGLSTVVANAEELLQSVCGTAKYQAPEIVAKIGYSFPVDVWAIGCTYYRLHYQVAPFDGASTEEIYRKLRSKKVFYPLMTRYYRIITKDERAIMGAILQKNPKKRSTIVQLLQKECLKQGNENSILAEKMSILDQLKMSLGRVAFDSTVKLRQRLNYSIHDDASLVPSYWVNESVFDESNQGIIYYIYNNANLFGGTFSDKSHLLLVNGQTFVYRENKNSTKYQCFKEEFISKMPEDLKEKCTFLLKKHGQLYSSTNKQLDTSVKVDQANLGRLPWVKQRITFFSNRGLVKTSSTAYHIRIDENSHLFQIGYLLGTNGANRNFPKWFFLSSATNGITVLKKNNEVYSVTLDFLLKGNCTALMKKYLRYILKYVNMLDKEK